MTFFKKIREVPKEEHIHLYIHIYINWVLKIQFAPSEQSLHHVLEQKFFKKE